MKEIKGFFGQYRFLSNFWPCRIAMLGHWFESTEAAYQAAKCADKEDYKKFVGISANEAKKLGRTIKLRDDWNKQRVPVMRSFLKQKFAPGSSLANQLLGTGEAYLEETNTWRDRFWGVFEGEGENNLGKLLMEIREELKEKMMKQRFHEIKGDIFAQSDADAICVTTNGIVKANGELVMGKGVAEAFKKKYPLLPLKAGLGVKKHGNHVQYFLDDLFGNTRIVCFPTKEDWRDSSPMWLIERSAKELVALADQKNWKKIVLTRPGCGNGGLKWEDVKAVLIPILDERFYVIIP